MVSVGPLAVWQLLELANRLLPPGGASTRCRAMPHIMETCGRLLASGGRRGAGAICLSEDAYRQVQPADERRRRPYFGKAASTVSHQPDAFHRRQVEALAGYGVPEADIAGMLGIDAKTLRKHYKHELAFGHTEASAKVAENPQGNGRRS